MARNDSDDDDVVIDKTKKKKTRQMKTYVFEIKLPDHTNDNISYTEFEFNWKDLVRKEEEKKLDPDIEIIEIDDDDEPKKRKKNTVKKPLDPEDDYDLEDDFIDDEELQVLILLILIPILILFIILLSILILLFCCSFLLSFLLQFIILVQDESVPEGVSTACGGFYINTGSLKYFQTVPDDDGPSTQSSMVTYSGLSAILTLKL